VAAPRTITHQWRVTHGHEGSITDLRHGDVHEDDWKGRDRFANRSDSRRPRLMELVPARARHPAFPGA